MSAGSGIVHGEYNREPIATTLFQIWILPRERGREPRWGASPFPKSDRAGRFVTLASGFAEDSDALRIRADARVLGATIKAGQSVDYVLGLDRKAYLVPAAGSVRVNGTVVGTRDGAAIADLENLTITALEDSEIVMVEVV
jgi:redox-sensitive bicupin YhaK (pirin superfamily)